MSMFSKGIKDFHPEAIIILADRQRSGGEAIDTSDIDPSIAKRGVMHPVIIKRNMELVAGERRLRSTLKLLRMPEQEFAAAFGYAKPKKQFEKIPTRFFEELSSREAKIVELEENERRKDLEWRDHVRAIAELHKLYSEEAETENKSWSVEKSGEMLNYSKQHMGKCLRIMRDIANPKIANAPGLNAAYNILLKLDERKIADAMNSIQEVSRTQAMPSAPPPEEISLADIGLAPPEAQPAGATAIVAKPAAPALALCAPESILIENFIEWAASYAGPRFNFAHMDFPYGANVFGGPQSGRDKWTTYDDNPDVYWELIRAFCKYRDNFMLPSFHLMFWYSIDFHSDTLKLFGELAPEINFNPKPLIWTKSDNVGIISDPKRGGRHIYETCLFGSREDRFVLKSVSDSYACPTDKIWHPSTKPVPMLSHFMQMFVDEHTEMLDPTCGSGSSLRAAEALGAKRVLGLEMDAEHAEGARIALKQARAKASLARRHG